MNTYTLGFEEEDGSFAVVATINNSQEHFPVYMEKFITSVVARLLESHISFMYEIGDIKILKGVQSSPEYINLEESKDEKLQDE